MFAVTAAIAYLSLAGAIGPPRNGGPISGPISGPIGGHGSGDFNNDTQHDRLGPQANQFGPGLGGPGGIGGHGHGGPSRPEGGNDGNATHTGRFGPQANQFGPGGLGPGHGGVGGGIGGVGGGNGVNETDGGNRDNKVGPPFKPLEVSIDFDSLMAQYTEQTASEGSAFYKYAAAGGLMCFAGVMYAKFSRQTDFEMLPVDSMHSTL